MSVALAPKLSPLIDEILIRECKKLGHFPRDSQFVACREMVEFIEKSKKKFMTLMAPCGSGKTVIAKTIADYLNENYKGKYGKSAIVTISNQLIDQYSRDFKDINVFRGKAHYPCSIGDEWTCEMGSEIIKNDSSFSCPDCPFKKSQNRCFKDPYSFYNPVSWLRLPRFVKDPLESKNQLELNVMIIDEAHELGNFLSTLSEMTIWEKDVTWKEGVTSSISGVIELLEKYFLGMKNHLKRMLKEDDANNDENRRAFIKEILVLKRKISSTEMLIDELVAKPDDFLAEECIDSWHQVNMKCLKIRSINPPEKLLNNFFAGVDKIIFMSGTIWETHMKEFLIEKEEFHKFEIDSPIDVENRLVIVKPHINCSYKNRENYPKQAAEQIEEIVGMHPGQRGLISVSYADLERLKPLLKGKRYVFNTKNSKKNDLSSFLKHKKNDERVAVFAASSVGLDLKDELCRFIIIPKVKVANWGDVLVQMKARKFSKELWYESTGMIDIIQASARGCRHETDFCTIYILDSNFIKYYSQTKHFLPKYFTDSVRICK